MSEGIYPGCPKLVHLLVCWLVGARKPTTALLTAHSVCLYKPSFIPFSVQQIVPRNTQFML